MKSIGLKWKIYVIGFVPFIFFLMAALSYPLKQNYTSYQESKVLKSKMDVIEAASAVVHESQKERGKTAGFLNGAVSLSSLEEQRGINNDKIDVLKSKIKESSFSEDYKRELQSEIEKYGNLRSQVNSKEIPLPAALKQYSKIIARFLDIQLDVADQTSLTSVSSKLKSFRVLEDAKESGGKLRANMSVILARNTAIPDSKLSAIMNLKAGVDQGVRSSALSLDEKSKTLIQSFKSSSEWNKVNKTFALILKNSDKGEYNKDSNAFFSTISSALNILGSLIIHQKDRMIHEVDSIQADSMAALWQISGLVGLLTIAIFGVMLLMSGSIIKQIKEVIVGLKTSSNEVATYSGKIDSASTQLSDAAIQQASSLQETVSSVDEISSMVQRNADAAGTSTKTSEKSQEEANKGKANIDAMIQSINEIAVDNEEIMREMRNNNDEISKITSVIAEIGEKTKVINDIVFQTKLLSFNASVEAARAGEHGKGFAVVAEEVGNLAFMSGKAALEISEILESSIKQVNDIVEGSKSKVERLVSQGKVKLEQGTHIARKCGDSLESILQNVNSVNEMIREIAAASNEQSIGIREITKAMQSLDQMTHQNTSSAQSSSSMASDLRGSAETLDLTVNRLIGILEGGNSSDSNDYTPSSPQPLSSSGNVIDMPTKATPAPKQSELKVSGSDTSVPSANDPRFEDL